MSLRVMLIALVSVAASSTPHAQPTLLEIEQGTNIALALSPEEDRLVVDLLGRLWVLPATGGAATALTEPELTARNPRFRPDGAAIVFQGLTDDQWDVMELTLDDARIQRLAPSSADDYDPDYTPDGQRVVFTSLRDGNERLWEVDLASGAVRPLVEDEEPTSFAAVSDQGVLAYVSRSPQGPYSLRLRPPQGPTTELYRSDRQIAAPSWRPGGGALVFHTLEPLERSELHLLVLSAKPLLKTLVRNEDVFMGRVAWTRDSDIYYAADGRVWRRGLALTTRYAVPMFAGTTVKAATPPPAAFPLVAEPDLEARPRAVSYSADGREAVFVALGDLWHADRRGAVRRLSDDPYMELGPLLCPDGHVVFASDRSGNLDLWRLSLEQRVPMQLTHGPENEYAPALSPDGSQIAYMATATLSPSATHSVRVLDLDRPERVVTLAEAVRAPHDLRWAAGGTALELSVLDEDGGTRRSLRLVTPGRGKDAIAAPPPSADAHSEPPALPWPAPRHTHPPYVIQVGRLFDGVGNQYRRHVDVHVEDGRIREVVGRNLAPLPERVIDARDLTVMPGLIDLRAHLTDLGGERLGRAFLYYGVTAVQDVSEPTAGAIARAEAWLAKTRRGPRVFVPPSAADGMPPSARALGASAADLRRPWTSGRSASRTVLPTLSPLGRGYQDVVTVLAHGRQVFLPTLAALGGEWQRFLPQSELQAYGRLFAPAEQGAPITAHRSDVGMRSVAATAMAILRAGGHVGVGSDAPTTPYGLGLHAELASLAAAGLPSDQALRLATSGAALALGLETLIGSVEPGKVADMLVLRGDPLARIEDTLSITAIVQDGEWLYRHELLESNP